MDFALRDKEGGHLYKNFMQVSQCSCNDNRMCVCEYLQTLKLQAHGPPPHGETYKTTSPLTGSPGKTGEAAPSLYTQKHTESSHFLLPNGLNVVCKTFNSAYTKQIDGGQTYRNTISSISRIETSDRSPKSSLLFILSLGVNFHQHKSNMVSQFSINSTLTRTKQIFQIQIRYKQQAQCSMTWERIMTKRQNRIDSRQYRTCTEKE